MACRDLFSAWLLSLTTEYFIAIQFLNKPASGKKIILWQKIAYQRPWTCWQSLVTTEYPKPCCTPGEDLQGVNVKFTQVTIGAVSSTPHLDHPLYGLHRHVLLQGSPSLVLYHWLNNTLLTVGIIIYSKVRVQVFEKFSLTLKSLKFGSPGCGILLLSQRWRLFQISKNLFLGITFANAGTPNTQSDNQLSRKLGSL